MTKRKMIKNKLDLTKLSPNQRQLFDSYVKSLPEDEDGFVRIWEGTFGPFVISKGGTIALTITCHDGSNDGPIGNTLFKHTETIIMDKQVTVNHGVMFYKKEFMGMTDVYGVVVGEKA